MNKQILITQAKRELWENKVGFVYVPFIVTALLLLIMAVAVVKFSSSVDGGGINFNFSHQGNMHEKVFSLPELLEKVSHDGAKMYSDIIKGVVFSNCALLYMTFLIVFLGYAHGSLFDDRKNRDILFWRSMPVSETINVLTKFGFLLIYFPLVLFVLNVVLVVLTLIFSIVFLAAHGISVGLQLSAIAHSDIALTLGKVLSVSMLDMVLLTPVISFILLASAYTKKSPFLTTSLIPAVLIMMDKIVNYMTGINLHVIDTFYGYIKLFAGARSAFESGNAFPMDSASAAGYLISLIMVVLFVNGAIWLRNNRYEI